MPHHVMPGWLSGPSFDDYFVQMSQMWNDIVIYPEAASLFQDETQRDHIVLLDHLLC